MLGFDNMDNRPLKGTSDWQEASVVSTCRLAPGAGLWIFFGGGKMWVNGQRRGCRARGSVDQHDGQSGPAESAEQFG